MTNAEASQIIEWTSDENYRHMVQRKTLGRLVDEVLEDWPKQSELVRKMTPFQQISFLEEVIGTKQGRKKIASVTASSIHQFVEDVRPDKNGFRTADDYK